MVNRCTRSSPPRRSRALGLGALLLSLLSAGCGGGFEGERDQDSDGVVPAVEILQARAGSLPLEEELYGVVKARNQVAIRPEIEATVVEVMVRSGERVSAGQPLVRLDAQRLREQLSQAEAGLRSAEADLAEARARAVEIEALVRRTRALHAEELVSDLELETQEAQLEAASARSAAAVAEVDEARATMQERRNQRSKTVVRSPVSGRVGRRNVEIGMLVDPSSVLFVVGDFDELIVEVPLTEGLLAQVEEGTPVRILADSLGGESIRAELSRISPFLEESSFSTTGEIDLRNPGGRLRPGMFVTVEVLYGETAQATLVPASAVWEDPGSGELGVYRMTELVELDAQVEHGEQISAEAYDFELVTIDVLAEGEASVGVAGIEPGAWVVTLGQQLLHDATRGGTGRRGGGREAGHAERSTGEETRRPTARVRVARWDDVMTLQGLQREDLLRDFLAKQRIVARELGADIPPDPAVVDAVIDAWNRGEAPSGGGD